MCEALLELSRATWIAQAELSPEFLRRVHPSKLTTRYHRHKGSQQIEAMRAKS
jgi:hypothetical protein